MRPPLGWFVDRRSGYCLGFFGGFGGGLADSSLSSASVNDNGASVSGRSCFLPLSLRGRFLGCWSLKGWFPLMTDTLVAAATKDCRDGNSFAERLAEIESPDWGPHGIPDRGDYWEWYIPAEVREIWHSLPLQSKVAVFLVARSQADRFDD